MTTQKIGYFKAKTCRELLSKIADLKYDDIEIKFVCFNRNFVTYIQKFIEDKAVQQKRKEQTILEINVLLDKNSPNWRSGKNPKVLEASIIYIANVMVGITLTQKNIAAKYNITQASIGQRYKQLLKIINWEKEFKEAHDNIWVIPYVTPEQKKKWLCDQVQNVDGAGI